MRLSSVLLALVSPALLGQALNFGTFLGGVKDPSGAGIPNAKVVLTRTETGTVRETMTDNEGNYRFPEVPAGRYRFEFEHAGFRKVVRDQIALSAGQSLRVDGDLTLGSVTESVVVDAKVAEVDTNTANVGSTVFGSQVRELALNTRSFTQLMTLQPGVASSQAQQPGFGSNTSVPFSFNGAQQSSNNWLVDGGRNIDTYNGNNLTMVNLDAIAEVRIERNAYSVEYGRNSGAQINVITKSGTNAIHGSLFEFFRNDRMDARNFFAAVKPKNRYNNFGGTFGGPIRKDKLFVFVANEYRRIVQTTGTRTTIVPTAAQLNGDFSGGRTISDPTTKVPFPGNRIPSALIDPNALALLNTYYARPTPGFQQGALNFSSSAPDVSSSQPCAIPPGNSDSRSSVISALGIRLHQDAMAQMLTVSIVIFRAAISRNGTLLPCPLINRILRKPWRARLRPMSLTY